MHKQETEFKIGDRIVITKAPDDYAFFSVGDEAILAHQDEDGDWWADFSHGQWCIEPQPDNREAFAFKKVE